MSNCSLESEIDLVDRLVDAFCVCCSLAAMATPVLAYSAALFPSFYDAMVASLPPEFEVAESHAFYCTLALKNADAGVKILDLCTGTGSISRCIATSWSSRSKLRIIGVDNSEAMLEVAKREWSDVPNVEVEWKVGTLGRRGALVGVEDADLALISAGSIHHLTTREEQLVAMEEVRDCLKDGGVLVLNIFAVDEIVDEFSSGDHGGADVWHLKGGFWKQTLDKVVDRLEDDGITGTETFKIGCENWKEEMICSWTLRALSWEDIRELCKEVGLVIQYEFRTFRDALDGRVAAIEEAEEDGRIFVIQKPKNHDLEDLRPQLHTVTAVSECTPFKLATTPTSKDNTKLFPAFFDTLVTSIPPEFEKMESETFYSNLTIAASPGTDVDTKVLDLCTGSGRIPRCLAAAWSKKAGNCKSCGKARSLQIFGVDNNEEMLKAARREWTAVPGVEMVWKRSTLGQSGALVGIRDIDIALISDGSFHLLATYQEQVFAMAEMKRALKVGGIIILNLFAVDDLVEDASLDDQGGLDVWHTNDGYWRETLNKDVKKLADGGITGTETFKIGCKEWAEEMVCTWTLRAVWWEDIRELCEEVGLVVLQEFRSFADALCGRTADVEETGDGGRVFVIQRQ